MGNFGTLRLLVKMLYLTLFEVTDKVSAIALNEIRVQVVKPI